MLSALREVSIDPIKSRKGRLPVFISAIGIYPTFEFAASQIIGRFL